MNAAAVFRAVSGICGCAADDGLCYGDCAAGKADAATIAACGFILTYGCAIDNQFAVCASQVNAAAIAACGCVGGDVRTAVEVQVPASLVDAAAGVCRRTSRYRAAGARAACSEVHGGIGSSQIDATAVIGTAFFNSRLCNSQRPAILVDAAAFIGCCRVFRDRDISFCIDSRGDGSAIRDGISFFCDGNAVCAVDIHAAAGLRVAFGDCAVREGKGSPALVYASAGLQRVAAGDRTAF